MWRPLALAGIAVLCAACESAVPLEKRSPATAALVQPWGKTDIHRTNAFLLPRESRVSVAVIAQGHGPQEKQVLTHLRSLVPQYFGPQDLADEALLTNEAIERAQEARADFLLTFTLQRWPRGFVDPAAVRCPERREDECNKSSIDPDLQIALQVYDVVNDRVIELMVARASLGVQSWLEKDISPLLDDTLGRMFTTLVP